MLFRNGLKDNSNSLLKLLLNNSVRFLYSKYVSRSLFTSFLFFSLFFISASVVFARSGCCSGHGGADCGAGPQTDGAVICKDGWTGSSCSYSSMVECGGTSTIQAVVPANPSPIPSPVFKAQTVVTPSPSILPVPTPPPEALSLPTPAPIIQPSTTPQSMAESQSNSGSGGSFLFGLLVGGGGVWYLMKRKTRKLKKNESE